LTGYSKYRLITLDAPGVNQTDLNLMFTVTYQAGMKSDFSDIQFVDSDGTTLLAQYRESYTSSITSNWWIKLPSLTTAGKTIYMWYGNSSATLNSVGADVFPAFHDGTGDLTDFTVTDYVTLSGGEIVLHRGGTSPSDVYANWNTAYGTNYALRCKFKVNDLSTVGTVFIRCSSNEYLAMKSNGCTWNYFGGSTAATQVIELADYIVEIRRVTGNLTRFYLNDILEASADPNSSASSAPTFRCYLYYMYLNVDWFYMYKLPDDGTELAEPVFGEVNTIHQGRYWDFAFTPTTTWGTAEQVTVNDKLLINSVNTLIEARNNFPDPSLGWRWNQDMIQGAKLIETEIHIDPRFSGRHWSFLAQIMGTDTVTGTGPYTHTITIRDAIDGLNLFGTFVVRQSLELNNVTEYTSLKGHYFELSGPSPTGFMQLITKGIVSRTALGADAVNSASDMDDITHILLDSKLPDIMPFGCSDIRINNFSGDALDDADRIVVSSLSFGIQRKLSQEQVSRNDYAYQWETAEPIEDGIPFLGLAVHIPDFALGYSENYQDGQMKKMDITWNYDDTYSVKLQIPSMKINAIEDSYDAGRRIYQMVRFEILKALSNPSGMAFDLPVVTIVDDYSEAYA